MIKNLISIGGTSTGLILDKAILALLQLEEGSAVVLDVNTATRTLTVRPADPDTLKRRNEFQKAKSRVLKRQRDAFHKLSKR